MTYYLSAPVNKQKLIISPTVVNVKSGAQIRYDLWCFTILCKSIIIKWHFFIRVGKIDYSIIKKINFKRITVEFITYF